MKIEFVSGFAAIAPDPATSRKLYLDTLGLPLEGAESEPTYIHTESLDGAKHFGVWPLEQAAEACFGTKTWPEDTPVPQASIEFEVADAAAVGAGRRGAARRRLRARPRGPRGAVGPDRRADPLPGGPDRRHLVRPVDARRRLRAPLPRRRASSFLRIAKESRRSVRERRPGCTAAAEFVTFGHRDSSMR